MSLKFDERSTISNPWSMLPPDLECHKYFQIFFLLSLFADRSNSLSPRSNVEPRYHCFESFNEDFLLCLFDDFLIKIRDTFVDFQRFQGFNTFCDWWPVMAAVVRARAVATWVSEPNDPGLNPYFLHFLSCTKRCSFEAMNGMEIKSICSEIYQVLVKIRMYNQS